MRAGQVQNTKKCDVPTCTRHIPTGMPFCGWHWGRLGQDLKRWLRGYGAMGEKERTSVVAACVATLGEDDDE